MPWAAVAAAAVMAGGTIYASGQSAKASKEAAALQATAEGRALQYQMDRERLPVQFRDEALSRLGGLSGLEGGTGSQEDLIDQAKASPLYKQIMGNRQLGEDAILRNASATGGLRSGDVQANLYDYNARLENEALLTSYDEQKNQLQGLAGLGLNTNAIANQMGGIGRTRAAGDIAAAQAQQAGWQNASAVLGQGIASLSDIRLKDNIKFEGTCNGHNVYSWNWNEAANERGLSGKSVGVMAHEVYEYLPDAVIDLDGYIGVFMEMLGIDENTELVKADA